MQPYYGVEPMYAVDWTPIPRNPWVLRCAETGAAYPNGPDRLGQPFKHWATAEAAIQYAERHNIPLVTGETL